ncbi:MAG: LysR family transcriptional regulator [Moraxellaceae bacterium]|nr:MAG: LysR family transcriptional regulator [Moraxellaceae bacterium]
MHDLNDLYFFAKTVEYGGFTAASRALTIPKSKLSRRIALLEERLNVRLIQRSSRQFNVTETGQKYYQYCQAMLAEAEAAQEFIDSHIDEPQGLIRMSCPPPLLYSQIKDMLARFMAAYPKVQIHVDITNRNVDVLAEGIDIALRVRFPPFADSDLVVKNLAINTLIMVAHPKLILNQGNVVLPDELKQLPSVGLGNAEHQYCWILEHHQSHEVIKINHQPRLIINDIFGVIDAVKYGVGVAPVPVMMIESELKSGSLIQLCPDWYPVSGVVQAVFPSRRGILPAVRHLLDFLEEEFSYLTETRVGFYR